MLPNSVVGLATWTIWSVVAIGCHHTIALAFSSSAIIPSIVSSGRCRLSGRKPSFLRSQLEDNNEASKILKFLPSSRRSFINKTIAGATSIVVPYVTTSSVAYAASVPVQRAVGSAESKCRESGNCLETFELDGAVGWTWGGADRCDASNPLCGPDGRLRDIPLKGQPVPLKIAKTIVGDEYELEITDVVELTLGIGTGSNAETDTLVFGLYGKKCPELVKEMTDLCGKNGIVTSRDLLLGAPVRLGQGCGSLTYIKSEQRLDFGVASQKVAYAKSIRKAKAPEEFVPQPRPSGERLKMVKSEQSARSHDVAGLISVPKEGIGYGGGLLGKDDEAYTSSFQVTAAPAPALDQEGRKVIGQLLDENSMNLLARLAGSPTKKLVPGQVGGPPLIKVVVDSSDVISRSYEAARE